MSQPQPVNPATKAARQARICSLLTSRLVRSQAELGRLLAGEGVEVTQATLSRDLEEVGAVKVRRAGAGTVYAVPDEPSGPVLRAPADSGRCSGHFLRQRSGTWDSRSMVSLPVSWRSRVPATGSRRQELFSSAA